MDSIKEVATKQILYQYCKALGSMKWVCVCVCVRVCVCARVCACVRVCTRPRGRLPRTLTMTRMQTNVIISPLHTVAIYSQATTASKPNPWHDIWLAGRDGTDTNKSHKTSTTILPGTKSVWNRDRVLGEMHWAPSELTPGKNSPNILLINILLRI